MVKSRLINGGLRGGNGPGPARRAGTIEVEACGMDAKTIPIRFGDGIREVMEERGIREEDIREVLDCAGSSGRKLFAEGGERFLAKKRMGNFTCNVEYAVDGGGVEVLDLYSYVVQLTGQED